MHRVMLGIGSCEQVTVLNITKKKKNSLGTGILDLGCWGSIYSLVMADRSWNRSRFVLSIRWDVDNFNNWTTQKLIKELSKLGIRVPANIGKPVMKKLYLENRTSLSTNTDIRMINNRSNNNALTADIVPPNADSIIAENNNLLNDDSERLGFL